MIADLDPHVPIGNLPTPEREFLNAIFEGPFRGSPTEPVWKWADEHVALDAKMASERTNYCSDDTPWNRDLQDAIRDVSVREIAFMKCSQSGVTEGVLNVIRYMPDHCPGNVGYIINSDVKAKRLGKVRLAPTLRQCCPDKITADPDDFATLHMVLKNMEITLSGSGSKNSFREIWYRVVVLDEPEDHEQHDDGTTYSLAKSRFATVADHKLFVIGKPQLEGGIMHRRFCAGTQEYWHVPCPRCGEFIRLTFESLRFAHCKDLYDWDLEAVERDTYAECSKCHGRIDEHEKRAMNRDGKWIPAPQNERMRLDGRAITPEPGVRSFHISDYYSLNPGVRWGALAVKWLACHEIAPNVKEQQDFRANHDGLPFKKLEFGIMDRAVLDLRGGLVEESDGRRQVLGFEFGLCYEHHEFCNPLPIRPAFLTITADRQGDRIKYLVFAWTIKGEAYLVDYGYVADEDEFLDLRQRPYPWISVAGADPETFYTIGGLIDSRHRRDRIYAMCQRAQAFGWEIIPTRGSGNHSEFKGKSIRDVVDFDKEGRPIRLIEYHDDVIKTQFYVGQISRRETPRLWLPNPVPGPIITEWTSEKRVTVIIGGRAAEKWLHDETVGANDYGDCGKKQYIAWQVASPAIREAEKAAATPVPGAAHRHSPRKSRPYRLR